MSYAMGCFVAPILGGLLNDFYGFRLTCDIICFVTLAVTLFYFFGNLLPYVIQERPPLIDRHKKKVTKKDKKREKENKEAKDLSQYEELFLKSEASEGN